MSQPKTKQSPAALLQALNWRYATKIFDSKKKIPDENWNALEQALVLSPSSYGLQPWKFFVVQDPALREKLFAHSWKQKQVVDCSHFVVFTRLKKLEEKDIDRFIKRASEVRNHPVDKLAGYKSIIAGDLLKGPRRSVVQHWATYQAYIALGNLMTSAAVLGIDACPMEGIVTPKYDEVLKIDSSAYGTVVACALGYRSSEDKYGTLPKVRYEVDDVVTRL